MKGSLFLMLILILALAGCDRGPTVADSTFTWNNQEFRSRLTTPREPVSDITIVMLGGGAAYDLHWTTPPSYEYLGEHKELTIDGKTHRDADTIADALVAKGFRVFQWSSISNEDVTGLENPALARGKTYRELRELSRKAVAQACSLDGVDPMRMVLLGHSLGAARACQIADSGTAGIAMLSGAYVSVVFGAPSKLTDKWEAMDRAVTKAVKQLTGQDRWRKEDRDLVLYDWNQDGIVRPWERAGRDEAVRWSAGAAPPPPDFFDEELPVETLRAGTYPKLALYGDLDDTTIHVVVLDFLKRRRDITNLDIAVLPDLNHQLAVQSDELTGPIDPIAVQHICDWMSEHFAVSEP